LSNNAKNIKDFKKVDNNNNDHNEWECKSKVIDYKQLLDLKLI
jgi:hypothetical protein